MTVRYTIPKNWLQYDRVGIIEELTAAKASVLALTQIPFQRSWAEELQKIQLKREVAGTSRIEGADFTERELENAMKETPEQLETRSQRQAAAAVAAYRWIAGLPVDYPVNENLIFQVHRLLVSGCDDDHCAPGKLRTMDQNVTLGAPRHRGAEGGEECKKALAGLMLAAKTVFLEHDPLVQALALHYHFAAMHPFLDGNGRTARVLEAVMLQRTGLRDTLFIAMSNYYYEEKTKYLQALSDTMATNHDLTPFLKFALKGIESQCRRLFNEIRQQLAKALYRNTVTDLFSRLESPRKRVMSDRHVQLLMLLLEKNEMTLDEIINHSRPIYHVKNPLKALFRDLGYLIKLEAITHVFKESAEKTIPVAQINLDWPTQITETEFFKRVKEMPKSKVTPFLSK